MGLAKGANGLPLRSMLTNGDNKAPQRGNGKRRRRRERARLRRLAGSGAALIKGYAIAS